MTAVLLLMIHTFQSTPAYGGRLQADKCCGYSYLQPGLREPANNAIGNTSLYHNLLAIS
jgi:hypothetical protein